MAKKRSAWTIEYYRDTSAIMRLERLSASATCLKRQSTITGHDNYHQLSLAIINYYRTTSETLSDLKYVNCNRQAGRSNNARPGRPLICT
ncbi:hypothetical protein M8818_006432 [Zalaria obscura]|uniref:Uncharacterized protein n=1 Tax=Zalaria obscura TaxID=2024903 RepID=A0ACC3S5Q3_9PEZI